MTKRQLKRVSATLASVSLTALALAATAQAATPQSIVLFRPGVSAAAERALVTGAGGTVISQVHIINAVDAVLDPAQARKLRLSPDVVSVTPNGRMATTSTKASASTTTTTAASPCGTAYSTWCAGALKTSYIQSTQLDTTWNDGATGTGVGVAVLDTGIDGNLPDFQVSQTNTSSRVIASVVTNANATTPYDLYGHGTHVAGILAGNSHNLPSSSPNYYSYIGAAPNANLISIKVSDDHGNASVMDVINGLQFVVDHQSDYNIRVVNLSLASTTAQSYLTDPLDAAVEQAWFHGITVVAAAGNLGTASNAVDFAPANDPYVITVGAVNDEGTQQLSDDTLAPWSSRGVTQDGFTKPEVYAPGVHIVAPLAPNSDFASLCPSCVRDGSYFQISGTSMAAPIVSGMVADILQLHPGWTPTQVKSALIYNARQVGGGVPEVAGDWAINSTSKGLAFYSDKGYTPNTYIDPSTGSIDYTKASWSKASWSSLSSTDPLSATWSKASWSCATCSSTSTSTGTTSVPTKASWSAFFGDIPTN
jgi:serine protease AprX